MSSYGHILIELDELITAILVIPLGDWQNPELEIFEDGICGIKINFSSLVGDREFFMGLNESSAYKRSYDEFFFPICSTLFSL